ncbi:alpha-1,3-arabinosyltransferase XAT3-like [Hibiscus syriacus]|uniref:alpha-1,3-arabinosyltransferase XAT3-like n=1 Tax=Hibiscus syriacus TaxID=106335 RepID=UPI001921080E|nr:alpha-1,3-arabinosyltransferase XAT3-like [Hibiscus syriacus]
MEKESKRLVNCATLATCLVLIVLVYSTLFQSNDTINLADLKLHGNEGGYRLSDSRIIADAVDPKEFLLRRLVRGDDRVQFESSGFSCHTDVHSEVFIANKPVRIFNKGLTVYVPYDHQPQVTRTVKPYARKEDETAMKLVSPVQIVHGNSTSNPPPGCNNTHNVTAVVFSSKGFTGNVFHEFNEIIIPLFITTRHFRSRLKFVITDYQLQWAQKYNRVLSHLSGYDVINPDDGSVHCFPGAVIGLKYHNNLALNITDIPGGYSMFDFKHFLKESYNLKIDHVSGIKKPVLMLISRSKTRRFLNEEEMMEMMEELGFQVTRAEPERMSNLDEFAEVVNSCSVMVGAHGAGLTNEIFLPTGAVMVQVVPLTLEWAATKYFGEPAKAMGLQYLEYKIEPEESSLFDTYGKDHPVISDPESVISKGYYAHRSVYVDGQDLKINLERFKKTLIKAKQILETSTPHK